MEEQKEVIDLGATMRLGAWDCRLKEGSKVAEVYGESDISERHRHRFEVNNGYREQIEENGLVVSGTTHGGELVEIVELPKHPWFIAVQFHPEFKSQPLVPQPLFKEFIGASIQRKSQVAKA